MEITKTAEFEEDGYTAIGFVFMVDGSEVGGADVEVSETGAYVSRVDVDEEFRGQGIGTQALKELSRILGGITVAPDNEDAQRIYERLGDTISKSEYDEFGFAVDQGFGVYEI
jgi:ribosomal protein S18 acetylase RimI-like enzyme